MTTILVPLDYYLPGTYAGGALRSIANLVAVLGGDFEFRIISRDRDQNSADRYSNIALDTWHSVGHGKVMYLSPERVRARTLRRLVVETHHDVLYLNSLFSPVFTLSLLAYRRAGMVPKKPLVLAPRGQLSAGALGIKARKKAVFLAAARLARLYSGILWQASSADEEGEIHRHFDNRGSAPEVVVAPDLPTPWEQLAAIAHRRKRAGALKATFISRIARKKNLREAIEHLGGVSAPAEFDIYGPAEDVQYLRECEAAMATLPAHVRARYAGALQYHEVAATFAQYDLFLFPTLGENFGHVIIEALAAGCPVAVSDRTPFRDIEEKGAGWVVPLENPGRYRQVLEECAAMDAEAHGRMSVAAREYARRVITDPVPIEQHRDLFMRAARATRAEAPVELAAT